MRLVRFETARGRQSWGWLSPTDPGTVLEPVGPVAARPFEESLGDIAGLVAALGKVDTLTHDLAALKLLAPIARPSKIIAVGRNYRAHAAEGGNQVPEEPIVFGIMPSAITGPYEPVELPGISDQVDWEGELGVVIGRTARRVPRARAIDHIAGYVVLNDISCRDLQRKDGQWTRAKSFDSFKPMGPCMTTVDELGLAESLAISVKVNGVQKQQATTDQMVFPVAELIEFISAFCTLMPGDVIATGTPSGVGMGGKPPRYLDAGDTVETEIEGIGRLFNRIVATSAAATKEPSLA
ncbi:MAG: fumarylacetoacetate hydrolase family protein [Rhizobiales bacterium]|nr:fumarylacetoacetate hydrolase family protein [Hyphomicrobiales bacterium]